MQGRKEPKVNKHSSDRIRQTASTRQARLGINSHHPHCRFLLFGERQDDEMAPGQKMYPRATVKKIVKAHSNCNVSKNVDVTVSLVNEEPDAFSSWHALTLSHGDTQMFLDYG